MLKGKTLTPSNVLSLFRIFLLVPIYQGLSQNTVSGNTWALFYMILAVMSDFLDGFLARRLKQVSDLGKVLDPLADKVCILGVCLILTLPVRDNPLPFWFLLVILVREIGIVSGGYLIYRRSKLIVTSNIWGKSASAILSSLLISNALQFEPASPWLSWSNCQFLLWLSLSFMLVSTISYARRFYLLLGKRKGIAHTGILNANGGRESNQAPPDGGKN